MIQRIIYSPGKRGYCQKNVLIYVVRHYKP